METGSSAPFFFIVVEVKVHPRSIGSALHRNRPAAQEVVTLVRLRSCFSGLALGSRDGAAGAHNETRQSFRLFASSFGAGINLPLLGS